jgi:hypothetical protein
MKHRHYLTRKTIVSDEDIRAISQTTRDSNRLLT